MKPDDLRPAGQGRGEPGRVLGIDLGSRRIGVALSDARETLATPLTVLKRSGEHKTDHRRIAELASEEDVVKVVVGLPLDLDGKIGIAARHALDEVSDMATVMAMPIVTFDERLTTSAAHKGAGALQLTAKDRRSRVDMWAAAVMLQGWLDSNPRPEGPVDEVMKENVIPDLIRDPDSLRPHSPYRPRTILDSGFRRNDGTPEGADS